MRTIAWTLVGGLVAAGAVRTVLFLVYVSYTLPSPFGAFVLEGTSSHFAWRVQHGLELYPAGDCYPYEVNFTAPVYSWLVGGIGRLIDADLSELFRIGRIVTLLSSLVPALAAGSYLWRKEGPRAALAGSAFALGSAPLIGFAVMTRPDMLADMLGVTGFLLLCYRRSLWSLVAASVLLGLCCLTKQTGGAYLIAGTIVLLSEKDRRIHAGVLCVLTAALGLSVIGISALTGEPHILGSLLGQGTIPFHAAQRSGILWLLVQRSPELPFFSLVGLFFWMSGPCKDRSLAVLAAVLLVTSCLAVGKLGSDMNYFIGLRFLEMIAVGTLCVAATRPEVRDWRLPGVVAVGIALCIPSIWHVANKASRAYEVFASAQTESGKERLRRQQRYICWAADPSTPILTNSDYLAAYQEDRAPFLDAYLLRLRLEAGQVELSELLDRIESESFDYVLSTTDLADGSYSAHFWRFPDEVASAIRKHYRPLENDAGFHVYVPRSRPAAEGS